jgi:hypothetical protein
MRYSCAFLAFLPALLVTPGCRGGAPEARPAARPSGQAPAAVPAPTPAPAGAAFAGTLPAPERPAKAQTGAPAALSATIRVIPSAPVPMQPAIIEVRLRDAKGKPAVKRKLRLDLTMPAMTMPPNHPKAREQAPGVYRAEALFTMAGAWEVHADVPEEGGKSTRFTLAVNTR